MHATSASGLFCTQDIGTHPAKYAKFQPFLAIRDFGLLFAVRDAGRMTVETEVSYIFVTFCMLLAMNQIYITCVMYYIICVTGRSRSSSRHDVLLGGPLRRNVSPGRRLWRDVSPGRPLRRVVLPRRSLRRDVLSPGQRLRRDVSPGRRLRRDVSPGRRLRRDVSPGRRQHAPRDVSGAMYRRDAGSTPRAIRSGDHFTASGHAPTPAAAAVAGSAATPWTARPLSACAVNGHVTGNPVDNSADGSFVGRARRRRVGHDRTEVRDRAGHGPWRRRGQRQEATTKRPGDREASREDAAATPARATRRRARARSDSGRAGRAVCEEGGPGRDRSAGEEGRGRARRRGESPT